MDADQVVVAAATTQVLDKVVVGHIVSTPPSEARRQLPRW
jgi:hypothetical protein